VECIRTYHESDALYYAVWIWKKAPTLTGIAYGSPGRQYISTDSLLKDCIIFNVIFSLKVYITK
jgi:hypothetical protein